MWTNNLVKNSMCHVKHFNNDSTLPSSIYSEFNLTDVKCKFSPWSFLFLLHTEKGGNEAIISLK